jgi:hypothetical protein
MPAKTVNFINIDQYLCRFINFLPQLFYKIQTNSIFKHYATQ